MGLSGTRFLYKARCNIRGDMQAAQIDYDPYETQAPVARHEAVWVLVPKATAENLIEGGGH